MCQIVAHTVPHMPFQRATAVFHCTEHDMPMLTLRDGLCPFGLIDKAVSDGIAQIKRVRELSALNGTVNPGEPGTAG